MRRKKARLRQPKYSKSRKSDAVVIPCRVSPALRRTKNPAQGIFLYGGEPGGFLRLPALFFMASANKIRVKNPTKTPP